MRLESSLQLELWEHCNEIIYQMIAKSLGHKYNYLLARVAAGDGMKAYQSIKLLDNESTIGAKNQFLSDLMRLTMRATGTRDTPANMMTYYDKLIELDSKYKLANNGIGVDRDVLRTKLLELPSAYDKAVEFIEQDDAMFQARGLTEDVDRRSTRFELTAGVIIELDTHLRGDESTRGIKRVRADLRRSIGIDQSHVR